MLEISGSHSNIISDSYVFHYGNELVSRTGNKEIRHFVTTNFDQKYPFALTTILSTTNKPLHFTANNTQLKAAQYNTVKWSLGIRWLQNSVHWHTA